MKRATLYFVVALSLDICGNRRNLLLPRLARLPDKRVGLLDPFAGCSQPKQEKGSRRRIHFRHDGSVGTAAHREKTIPVRGKGSMDLVETGNHGP